MINQISKYKGEYGYVKNIGDYQVFLNGQEVGAVSANAFRGCVEMYVRDINGQPIFNNEKTDGIKAIIHGEIEIKKR